MVVKRKGQGSLLHIIIGVLIVSSVALFLFILQTGTTTDLMDDFSRRRESFNNQIHLTNFMDATYVTEDGDKLGMLMVYRYLCSYSTPQTLSPIDNDEAEEFIERYFNHTLEGPYKLEADHNDCPVISRGELDGDVISSSISMILSDAPNPTTTDITLSVPMS